MFVKLCRRATGDVLVANLELATTFSQRFWGLQFRSSLAADTGLLITPCNSIHTCWMRFTIDAIFLNTKGEVLAIKRVAPWRATLPTRGAACVVEVLPESVNVEIGEALCLVPSLVERDRAKRRLSRLQAMLAGDDFLPT